MRGGERHFAVLAAEVPLTICEPSSPLHLGIEVPVVPRSLCQRSHVELIALLALVTFNWLDGIKNHTAPSDFEAHFDQIGHPTVGAFFG